MFVPFFVGFGGGLGLGCLSKTRSLRHIHVALGLRHPWLRTVLESIPHPLPELMQMPN